MLRPIALVLLLLAIPFSSEAETMFGSSKEKRFWQWFQKNEERLFEFEAAQEAVLDELHRQMMTVHADLTFEFGPVLEDGRREFVISAGGIKSAFPAVEALAAQAPGLKRWIWVKFRPRRSFPATLTLNGKSVASDQVRYAMYQDGERVGLVLYMEGYRDPEKTTFLHMAYLFLDHYLGEYDVETRVGFIEVASEQDEHFPKSRLLSSLAERFDAHFEKQPKSYH